MNRLPTEWTTLPLGDAGQWLGGGTPSKSDQRFWSDGTIPWVSPKDMKALTIRDTEDRITEAALAESAARLIPSSSVLVVTRSGILQHTLPVAVNAIPVALNQDLKALSPWPGVEADYVAWALRRYQDDILRTCSKSGTTVQSVETSKLQQFEIPLAPLAEQRRIVAALEEHLSDLDAAVAGLERARANLERHAMSVLGSAVAGTLAVPAAIRNTLAIGEMGEVVTGTTPPTGEPENYGGTLPFFKPTDLNAGYHVREAREHLTARGARLARQLPAGSVLVTCIGATIGKCGLARVACATNQQINAVVPDTSKVMPEFLFVLLASPQGQTSITGNASATTLPILNKSKFSALRFDIPEINAQRTIVAEVERRFAIADRTAAEIDVQLARANRLRQSILKRALEGKLVPQDPDDEPASALLERIRAGRAGNVVTRANRRAPRTRAT